MAATESTVFVLVDGWDISEYVIWEQTSFSVSAAAQPGMCQVVLRGDENFGFDPGQRIELRVAPYVGEEDPQFATLMWNGFLFTYEQGYVFPDDPSKTRFVLSGVDNNIILDKLILYNHEDPTQYPDGDGTYKRRRVDDGTEVYGYIVTVPRYTMDRDYIKAMLRDFDLPSWLLWQGSNSRIDEVGMINPDGKFTPPSAGTTLRNFLTDVSTNVQRSLPGSTIWYVDPDGYLVYKSQDTALAPFWVGDDDVSTVYSGVEGVNVRDLRITTDISDIKNDVLIFTGNLDPRAESRQEYLKYRRARNTDSIDAYGRFQYSEILGNSWLQASVNARANKILNQQGEAAKTAEFTTYAPGLYPGQIVNVISTAHGIAENFPIRSITMGFPTPRVVEYRVSCSYDTNDPWGLLLALRKPVTRGLVNPNFSVIYRGFNDSKPITHAEPFTLVKEYPRSTGNRYYQCSYAYIRDSISVFKGSSGIFIRQVGVPNPDDGSVGFLETSPDQGVFRVASNPTGGQRVYVEYHVWHDLD